MFTYPDRTDIVINRLGRAVGITVKADGSVTVAGVKVGVDERLYTELNALLNNTR